MRQLFEPALNASSAAERRRLLAGAAAPAGWIITPAPPEELTSQRAGAGFAVLHALSWLALHLAAEGPLMIALDDLHWLDPASLRAVNYLAARISEAAIVLVAAMRPQEPGSATALLEELRDQPDATRIWLAALSADAVARLVQAQIPDADAAVCAACSSASGGNPLYLEELLRALPADFAPTAAEVYGAAVPSLGDRIARRVARVAPEAPSLLNAIAVLDDGAPLAAACALAQLAEHAGASIASRLRRIDVLASEDPVEFVHPLLRRSVYDALPVTERDMLHRNAAAVLERADAPTAAIAAHLAAMRPRGSTTAARTFVRASREALAMAAPDAATAMLRRALEEQAGDPPRAELFAELGFAEVAGRDLTAIEHLREALSLAHDPRLRARVASALSEILSNAGDWEASRAVLEQEIDALGEVAPEAALELHAIWTMLCVFDTRLASEFDSARGRALALPSGDGWPDRALDAALAAAAALRGGRCEDVLPRVEQALRGEVLFAERGAGGWASMQVLCALLYVDEFARALTVAEQLSGQAARVGSLVGVASALGARGFVLNRRGQLPEAEAELRAGLAMVAEAGLPLMVATAFDFFQDAIVERPSLDDVAELMEGIELAPVFAATWSGGMLLGPRGRARLARGERAAGLKDLRGYANICAALRFGSAIPWRSTVGLAVAGEDPDEARRLVDEELELARRNGLPRPIGTALRAAGVLRGGIAGVELLRESAATLARSEARLEHARALVSLGSALRRIQRRTEARRELLAGMELARRCGAVRLAEQAREELRAAGARLRRTATTGVEALTASELRIARLAAAGRTNAEIAQELWLSPKTVETHLSHAYGKLDLAGQGARAGLPGVLQAVAPEPAVRAGAS